MFPFVVLVWLFVWTYLGVFFIGYLYTHRHLCELIFVFVFLLYIFLLVFVYARVCNLVFVDVFVSLCIHLLCLYVYICVAFTSSFCICVIVWIHA